VGFDFVVCDLCTDHALADFAGDFIRDGADGL
jgi:hypothetical protein